MTPALAVVCLIIPFLISGQMAARAASSEAQDETPTSSPPIEPSAEAAAASRGPQSLHERIDMEEMKIQGMADQPQIMYIIPRARLEIEMKLNDDYFLLSPADPNEAAMNPAELRFQLEKKQISDQPIIPSSFYAYKPNEVRAGSCISCHYPEIEIPKGSRASSLLEELNQSCLDCHPSRYYHLCWREVEKTAFQSTSQEKATGQEKESCNRCHTPWTEPPSGERRKRTQKSHLKWQWSQWSQPKETAWPGGRTYWQWGGQASGQWGQRTQRSQSQPDKSEKPDQKPSAQKYDIDTFCVTCHKIRGESN